jgi:outer membrane protein insertion porin family
MLPMQLLRSCFALCVLISVALGASGVHAEILRDIRLQGNQRIESSAIESYLGLQRGDNIGRAQLDKGLKSLYHTGFFSDISLDFTDGVLRVDLEENPSINDIAFEGNNIIEDTDLMQEVSLQKRSIYTRSKVQADLKRLLDVYRRNGRYSAEITPKIIPREQNRVDLVFEIVEGPKAIIEKITFIGNDAFDSSDLRQVVSSAESRFYAFLSDSDRYDPDRLQYDKELLRRFYFANGYADFKVLSAIAELSPERDAFYLTFTLKEGEPYYFGKVAVDSSLDAGKIPDLGEQITTKTEDLYNATEVEESIDRMVNALGDRGFAFVDIAPKTKKRTTEDGENIIDLTYAIKEGPRVYVERINVFGNERTLDEVIRREFRLVEGDPYSTSKLKRSEERLNNLGYFETVNIKEKPGSSPDKTEIDVEVLERSTGEVTFGAGFSTVDGALADIGLRERNLLGRGQELRASTTFSARRQQYDLGFTEPYFLDRDLAAGVDLFQITEDLADRSTFDSETLGGGFRLGYSLSEKLRHQLRYNYSQTRITNVDGNASRFISDQEGENSTSLIGHSLVYDSRDNRFNPNHGLYALFAQDLAGLGGDDEFIRHELRSEYFYPISKKWVLSIAGAAGHIEGLGRDIPINQRFFIGQQQLRGFAVAGIGARDISTDDPLGNNTYYANTVELRFPLGLPEDLGLSGAVFHDFGSAFNLDDNGSEIRDTETIRASVGVGIAWNSPFGPIRIDFANAYQKEDFDDDEIIRFSFGTRF